VLERLQCLDIERDTATERTVCLASVAYDQLVSDIEHVSVDLSIVDDATQRHVD